MQWNHIGPQQCPWVTEVERQVVLFEFKYLYLSADL